MFLNLEAYIPNLGQNQNLKLGLARMNIYGRLQKQLSDLGNLECHMIKVFSMYMWFATQTCNQEPKLFAYANFFRNVFRIECAQQPKIKELYTTYFAPNRIL